MTPLAAERFAEAFRAAGLPPGVFQCLHLTDTAAEKLLAAPEVDGVVFTGSVKVGRAVERASAGRFVPTTLELGGKDPAYVRADANLAHAVENLVDGAFFNAGQSCCAIERIYVDAALFDRFVEGYVKLTAAYVLGDPLDPKTTLGPLVRASAAQLVRAQVAEATAKGARAWLEEAAFPQSRAGTNYLAPQVLTEVDHSMAVMTEESFGPVVGIMKVSGDAEALELMNDSHYGLTAALWTSDPAAAQRLGDQLQAGTVFMNRCDYLDPALAWSGVKDSGRGCSLSRLGFSTFVRPKSFHLRTELA